MAMFDSVASPTVTIEYDDSAAGVFVLGLSVLDGDDVLSAPDAPADWQAIPSSDVLQVSVRRGRQREDQAVQPGIATVVIDNMTGDYDPSNPSSSYMRGGYSILARGLPVRVRCSASIDYDDPDVDYDDPDVDYDDGISYTLFTGFLESTTPDQGLDPTVTLVASDALAWLADKGVAAIASSFSGDTTAARAARVLDEVAWPSAKRDLTGPRQMQPTTFGTTALALLEECASCEHGKVYADRDGTVVLVPYEDVFDAPVRLTLSDSGAEGTIEYDELSTSDGSDYLLNEVKWTLTTGTVVTAFNAESAGRFGTRADIPRTIPLLNTIDGEGLAQLAANRYAFPRERVESVSFAGVGLGDAWADLLTTDLGDRAVVERTTVDGRDLTVMCMVESIAHDIAPGNWRSRMSLSPASAGTAFVLDSSDLDSPDGL